ncbi:Uncharacterised protein [uncultured archaeon]|nr:Uncharacterised protein [uncultured archaeon]
MQKLGGNEAHRVGPAVKLPTFLMKRPKTERLRVLKVFQAGSQTEGLIALKDINCPKSREFVALKTGNVKVGFAAVDGITDEKSHMRIAKRAAHAGVAAYSAKKVVDGPDPMLEGLVLSRHEVVQCMATMEIQHRVAAGKFAAEAMHNGQ